MNQEMRPEKTFHLGGWRLHVSVLDSTRLNAAVFDASCCYAAI